MLKNNKNKHTFTKEAEKLKRKIELRRSVMEQNGELNLFTQKNLTRIQNDLDFKKQ